MIIFITFYWVIHLSQVSAFFSHPPSPINWIQCSLCLNMISVRYRENDLRSTFLWHIASFNFLFPPSTITIFNLLPYFTIETGEPVHILFGYFNYLIQLYTQGFPVFSSPWRQPTFSAPLAQRFRSHRRILSRSLLGERRCLRGPCGRKKPKKSSAQDLLRAVWFMVLLTSLERKKRRRKVREGWGDWRGVCKGEKSEAKRVMSTPAWQSIKERSLGAWWGREKWSAKNSNRQERPHQTRLSSPWWMAPRAGEISRRGSFERRLGKAEASSVRKTGERLTLLDTPWRGPSSTKRHFIFTSFFFLLGAAFQLLSQLRAQLCRTAFSSILLVLSSFH